MGNFLFEGKYCHTCARYCEKCSILPTNCVPRLPCSTPGLGMVEDPNFPGSCGCPPGKFFFACTRSSHCPYEQCRSCEEGCLSCFSSSVCSKAEDGYYIDEQSNSNPCHSSCKACAYVPNTGAVGQSYCLTCNDPTFYVNDSGICVCDTSTNHYVTNGPDCEACQFPCTKCITKSNFCLECAEGYTKSGSTCFCEEGKYTLGRECIQCAPTCKTCRDSASFCTSCFQDRFLQDNKCLLDCPPRHYLSNGKCIPCGVGCLECSSE